MLPYQEVVGSFRSSDNLRICLQKVEREKIFFVILPITDLEPEGGC